MKYLAAKLIWMGVAMGLCGLPALAQFGPAPVTLNNANGVLTFNTNGQGVYSVTLGTCTDGSCTLSGPAQGSIQSSPITGYSITSPPNMLMFPDYNVFITCTNTGPDCGPPASASVTFTGPSGTVVTYTLSYLWIEQQGTNYMALKGPAFSASAKLISGPCLLSVNGNFPNSLQDATMPESSTAAIIPEPPTTLLFATGLLLLAVMLRCRHRPTEPGSAVTS